MAVGEGGGGGGGGGNEFQPHPVKEQLPGVDFCVSSSPAWRNSLSLSVFFFWISSMLCFLFAFVNFSVGRSVFLILFFFCFYTTQCRFLTRRFTVHGFSRAFFFLGICPAWFPRKLMETKIKEKEKEKEKSISEKMGAEIGKRKKQKRKF